MALRTIAAVTATALTGACTLQGGHVYQAPIAEAHRILIATGLPPMVFGSEEPSSQVLEAGSDVIWVVQKDGSEVFRYIAHLEPEGPGATRVKVEFKAPESGPSGNVAQRLAQHPEVKHLYLVAIDERIASALEHRPFDITRVYPATIAATVANMGAISASADAAAAASEREARANIAKAYQEEAEGVRR